MGLEDIIKNNHYPIIFIGSGMSKRYLTDSPDWNTLLEEYWAKLNTGVDYYTHLHELQKQIKGAEDLDFTIKAKIAAEIENKFDDEFYNKEIDVPRLTLKDAFENKLSPFRVSLSQRFKNYNFKPDIDNEEFELFTKVLEKARIIVTTNYDTLIEDTISKSGNQHPKVYIGNEGFFDNLSIGWSEIYKIHGSVTSPSSIVITEDDYKKYDQNSILVTAKILSSMVDSPILFLGYSMTDRNVLKMLNDFSAQLPKEDINKSANRILIVERDKNEKELNEAQMVSLNNKFSYTLIKTDNFKELFARLQKVNEGVSPYEVKKYEKLIRKLIISSGKKGTLKSVLISPDDLDNLDKKIDEDEPIVIALGDSKYFYVYPDLLSYVSDYFNNTNNYAPEVALSFAAHEGNSKTRIPFSKYWKNIDLKSTRISKTSIKNLKNKINECGNFSDINKSIPRSYKIRFTNIDDIKRAAASSKNKLYELLSFNIKNIDKNELKEFVFGTALLEFNDAVKNNTALKSLIRKFLVAYDFLINGPLK